MKTKKPQKGRNWIFAIAVLIILGLLSLFFALILGTIFIPSESAVVSSGNVAKISVIGTITSEGTGPLFGGGTVSSEDIIELIKKADESKDVKAILFEINSPGGTAVASEGIARAVKKVNKTTVALIKDVGASGAYWIASAADLIVANPLSITGSVGVLSSYLEFSGLMEKYGVGYERIVGGEYKDIGTPFRNLTEQERKLLQERIDQVHEYFSTDVAKNRGLTEEQMRNISSGIIYTGIQAKELGLVDVLGGEEEAKELIKKRANLTVIQLAEYKKKKSLLDILTEVFSRQSYSLGSGIGDSLASRTTQGFSINA